MNDNKRSVTCAQVKEMDMVDYLSAIGIEAKKVQGNDHWYLSPFRSEKTASFKINRSINRWYDHGIGKGGDLIDFLSAYGNCTVSDVLKRFQEKLFFSTASQLQRPQSLANNNSLKILQVSQITSFSLLEYFKQRGIPVHIALDYCQEIRYEVKQKKYYGIGFKNDEGGYEIRNEYYKMGSSPKGITSIKNNIYRCAVFEGFFDFLSFLFLFQNNEQAGWSFCILNSLSFFEKSLSFLNQFASIHLFLDNDIAGQDCSQLAIERDKKFIDESHLYRHYKDLNEWLMSMGKKARKGVSDVPP